MKITKKPFQETNPTGKSPQNQESFHTTRPVKESADLREHHAHKSTTERIDSKYTHIGRAVMRYLKKHLSASSSQILTYLRREEYGGDLRTDLGYILERGTAIGAIDTKGLCYVPGVSLVRSAPCLRRRRRPHCPRRKVCPCQRRGRCPSPGRCRRRRCCGCSRLLSQH